MNGPASVFPTQEKVIDKPSVSQLRLLITLMVGIFVAEVLAMILIYYIKPPQYWLLTLLDASIMTVLIFPILYYFHFRPLYNQINERNRSETLLRKVLENMPVGVWIIDKNGKIVHGNRASLKIWSGAKYVGIDHYGDYKAWWIDSGKLVEPQEWAGVRSLRRGETVLEDEVEIECFDGTHKIILNSATPIYENESVAGAIVVNQDITQRKQYEQDLLHSKELIQRAFNSTDVLIAYMDRYFNFIEVNETYARNAGHPVDYFTGKNHFDLYPHTENQAIFQRVVDTQEPYLVKEKPFEYSEFPERGVTYWNWGLQPVLGADGCVQGLVLSLVDVTDRKQAELLLERQNRELSELSIAERKQRRLTEGLVQSMLALNASLELQDVLRCTLEQIQHSIPYERANIMLVEDNQLRVVRHFDLTGPPEMLLNGEKLHQLDDFSFAREMCTTRQPVLVEDTAQYPHAPAIPGMTWLRSYLAVPMIIGERMTGFINLTSNQPGSYTQETARRLMAFAAPAALAAENARLFAAELQARQVAETLHAVSRALTQTLDFDRVLNTLLEYVSRLVPSERAYIMIFEGESDLSLQSFHSLLQAKDSAQTLESPCSQLEESLSKEVITTRKTLLVANTDDHPVSEDLVTCDSIRCWLGIPITAGKQVIGVLALTKERPGFFTRNHIQLSEAIVSQASVAIQNAWLFEQVVAGHERLQSLSRRLVEVQENERRYVARELHDEASQALTALMFGLHLMEQEADRPQAVLARLEELKKLTDRVLEELHRLAMGLRPASLDYLGLVVALEQLVKDMDKRYSVKVHYVATGFTGEPRLPEHYETNIYRIVQEALTNAIRHANANNIDVILENRDGKIIVIVEDDGVGFDATQVLKAGHLGLMGMQERAQMISGMLQVESTQGARTTIVLEVPYDDPHRNR